MVSSLGVGKATPTNRLVADDTGFYHRVYSPTPFRLVQWVWQSKDRVGRYASILIVNPRAVRLR